MFLNLLTKWKTSKNALKYILIVFIIIIALLEVTRLFIHNLTTRVGWWMFITGVTASMVIIFILLYKGVLVPDNFKEFIDSEILRRINQLQAVFH